MQRIINVEQYLEDDTSEQVRFYCVPKSSFKLVKENVFKKRELVYYENLLQLVVSNVSIIYDLDPDALWKDEHTSMPEIDVMCSTG